MGEKQVQQPKRLAGQGLGDAKTGTELRPKHYTDKQQTGKLRLKELDIEAIQNNKR